jgi:hypothetical protein
LSIGRVRGRIGDNQANEQIKEWQQEIDFYSSRSGFKNYRIATLSCPLLSPEC